MSPTLRVHFTAVRASGRLRPGQGVDCQGTAVLDDGPTGSARLLVGVPGGRRYFARVVPVDEAEAERAVRALAAIGHPTVAAPVGAGRCDDGAVVVQELPDGERLAVTLARHVGAGARMPLADIARVARPVASALRHLHQARIAHGGLTADVVWSSARGASELEVAVSDAGVVPLAAAGAPSFPWRHLGPECDAHAPTPEGDLYAFGVLLAELLVGSALVPPTGTRPWRELSAGRHASVRATLAQARPDAADDLTELVAALLHPKPSSRPSATELTRALGRVTWEPKAEAPRPADPERPRDPAPSPAASPPRHATLAPSRSFVVAATSQPRAPDAPRAAPMVRPPNEDATASDMDLPAAPASDGTVRWQAPRSWFAEEATTVSASPPPDDDDITVAGTSPRVLGAAGFFAPEGTLVLEHPDQLAGERLDTSLSEGTMALPTAPPPVLDATAPRPLEVGAFLATVEQTMPDGAGVPVLRAPVAPPRATTPVQPPQPPQPAQPAWLTALEQNRALLVAAVVTSGVALGAVIWALVKV